MQIAVLGAGNVGTVLARGLLDAGHEVELGVRDLGAVRLGAPATTPADAVADAAVVVNALPGSVSVEVLRQVGADALAGKVLLDVANAVTPAFELLHPDGSLGALLQAEFPATRVVKTLNTVPAASMADPGALPGPSSVFLSGNDAEAKEVVAGLLADLGWSRDSVIDLGPIDTARATEHYLYLSLAIMKATGSTVYNVRVVR
ncbi:NAD(P)-binding domain-containing protein [Kineococcus sp. NUM-3379]